MLDKHKKIDDFDDDNESSSFDNFHIEKLSKGTQYIVTLDESIKPGFEYLEIYTLLRKASPQDSVVFNLSNYGGDAFTCFRLATEIALAKTVVTMRVVSPCFSAASILALTGDKLVMFPHTFLHFHNMSTLEMGKWGELKYSVATHDKWFKDNMKHFCYPFLTKGELGRIHKDEDIAIFSTDKDIVDRWKKHVTKRSR